MNYKIYINKFKIFIIFEIISACLASKVNPSIVQNKIYLNNCPYKIFLFHIKDLSLIRLLQLEAISFPLIIMISNR